MTDEELRRKDDEVIRELTKEVASTNQRLKDHIEDESADVKEIKSDVKALTRQVGAIQLRLNQVPHDEHLDDHSFIRAMAEEKQARTMFWREQWSRLATASIWGVCLILAGAIWYLFTHWLNSETGVDLTKK